jgi:ectoine hydroxylase-related dioxygenase (phytanoyl-CoA dioxygenase family)
MVDKSILRDQYDREGYAIYNDVIDKDLIGEASDHVNWLLEQNPDLRPEQLHNNLMKDDPFWVRLISDDRLLDIAEEFVGPNIALFASHYISKPPTDGQPVLWHQDGSYWPLDPMEVVTLWLAVDDSLHENGCMRVIPRTQDMQLHEMKKHTEEANVLSSRIDPEFVNEEEAVDIELKVGSVSVHHPNIVHGSNPNTSDRRRCGLTIRYIPTSTRILSDDEWPSAFLLRGHPVEGVNDYLDFPRYKSGKHMAFSGCEKWK